MLVRNGADVQELADRRADGWRGKTGGEHLDHRVLGLTGAGKLEKHCRSGRVELEHGCARDQIQELASGRLKLVELPQH